MKRLREKTMMLLAAASLLAVPAEAAKITVQVNNRTENGAMKLYLSDGRILPVELDAAGRGEVTVDNTQPMYVRLNFRNVGRTLWLAPNADLHLTFDEKEYGKALEITGEGAPENLYLNSGQLHGLSINDAQLSEQAFLHKGDSLLQASLQRLEQANLPQEFNRMEQVRLPYLTYASLPLFPYYHKRIAKDSLYTASPAYWQLMERLTVTNKASLLSYREFCNFLDEASAYMAKQKYPDMPTRDAVVRYVESDVTDPRVAEYLIYNNVYTFGKNEGLEAEKRYGEVFARYVKSPELVKKFKELCDDWRKLAVGAASPSFSATDVEGKSYTLADFRGKYVYIDIWATWCGPCQREIPHLQKLEEQYHGKDICFVSLSCDGNRNAWEKRVKGGLKGIQLHVGTDSSFLNAYMVTGIPRFILLDKEGRIVSADMTRPSNPETVTRLNELLGIGK